MDPVVVLFGLGVGLLVGMTGIGGGSIMTPLLILVLGTKPVIAVGTDLTYAAITKTLGGWRHLRQGTVHVRLAMWLSVGSVPGALGGVVVLERIHRSHGDNLDSVMLVVIGAAVLLAGIATVGRALLRNLANDRDTIVISPAQKALAAAIGLGVGFCLGLSSAGSGALAAVGLIIAFRLSPRKVVGTDIFHAAILLWAAAVAHLIAGNVDVLLAANLLVGSLPGVWVGSRLTLKVPERALRPVLGIVLCTAGAALLSKAGVAIPGAVVLGGFAVVVSLLALGFARAARSSDTAPLAASEAEADAQRPLGAAPLLLAPNAPESRTG